MRALLSTAPGGPETLTLSELPDPVAGRGQVVIAVKACAINFPDVLIIEDKYQFKPERPFAPGGEIAGIIDAVGEGVEGWQVGDRVIAMLGHGGLCEKVIADPAKLYRLPEGRSFAEGASLILTYGTTIHALLDRGHIAAGQTLLVLGAAGGVGLAAIDRLLEVAQDQIVTVDLETMTVTTPFQDRFSFDLDAFRRQCLMEGLDEVGLTLARDTQISKFEEAVASNRPWTTVESGYASIGVEGDRRT